MPPQRNSSSDAPPFVTIGAEATGPIVLTCEHAGRRLPFRGRVAPGEQSVLASHWGWDLGAWALTGDLARRLDASAVGGRWSRLLIDLNRRMDDPTLILPRAGDTELSWNRDLPLEEIERRFLRYHAPYHQEVDRLILRRRLRECRPLLVAMHTFTPMLGRRRRCFDAGVLYEHHRGLAHRLGRKLRGEGLTVRYNQPYSGVAGMMYSAERHGTHHGLPCLELEFNQSLFDQPGAARALGGAVARGLRLLIS